VTTIDDHRKDPTVFERVLIPLDGSAAARGALSRVERLLREAGSQLILLRVVDEPTIVVTEYPGLVAQMANPGQAESEAQAYVDGLATELKTSGMRVATRVMTGRAAESILRIAEREQATSIAMATHGRSGVMRWAMGSVAEKVLRTSKLPLCLVRSSDTPPQEEPRDWQHVVVPVDGSPLALQAVPTAAQLAKLLDLRVTVVHFVSDYAGKAAMPVGQQYLEQARVAFAAHEVDVELDLRRGDPAAGLVDYGLMDVRPENRADVVCMCSHGRSGVRRAVYGSVTEKLLRHAVVPLLVVHGNE
jgi:nucleotide-binding universal stress UspA family protein